MHATNSSLFFYTQAEENAVVTSDVNENHLPMDAA